MAKTKYTTGTILKHKQYGFIIQIKSTTRWCYFFDVIKGEMPNNLLPGNAWDENGKWMQFYRYETMRTKFEVISGAGAEILFGNRNDS